METADKYERWTVIGPSKARHGYWRCICACGTERDVAASSLTGGISKSCGCLRSEQFRKRLTTHGGSFGPLYAVWSGMHGRCGNPHHVAYHRYGGRGIRVCDEWRTFAAFQTDMAPAYRPGLTLERENNDGDYSPDNCVWATTHTQARNRSSNRYVETTEGRLTIQDAAKRAGITWRAMLLRIEREWPMADLFLPAGTRRTG